MAGELFAYFVNGDPETTDLPLPRQATDYLAVVRGALTYRVPLSVQSPDSFLYYVPVDAETVVATLGLGAFVLDPAGALASLTVELPPGPIDGQIFEVTTSQDITALTATAPAPATVGGAGPFTLAADGGVSWRYVLSADKWFAR